MVEALEHARLCQTDSPDPLGLGVLGACLARLNHSKEALDPENATRAAPWAVFVKLDPKIDPLRNNPRFAALVARLGMYGSGFSSFCTPFWR